MKKCSEATQTLRAGCSKADLQTNTQTDRGDYNTLRSLAPNVIKDLDLTWALAVAGTDTSLCNCS